MMPFNKRTLYATHYNHVDDSRQDGGLDSRDLAPPVWIPTLDLADLTCDDDKDTGRNENNGCVGVEREMRVSETGERGHVTDSLFVRKQKPSFVFPTENSLKNLEMMKNKYSNPQRQIDEEPRITSVDSSSGHAYPNPNLNPNSHASPNHNPNHKGNQEPTPLPARRRSQENMISFSLGDENVDRYMRFGNEDLDLFRQQYDSNNNATGDVEIKDANTVKEGHLKMVTMTDKPEKHNKNVGNSASRLRVREKDKEKIKGTRFDVEDGLSGVTEEKVVELILVNGQLKMDSAINHLSDANEEQTPVDAVYDEKNDVSQASKVDKSKQRVTFSFNENLTPRGSIKRYTPLRGDANFQLQGVLKKRPQESEAARKSKSSGDVIKRDSRVQKEHVKFPSSSYHLEPKSGSHRMILEQGIPVKHIHTTSADLEKNQNRMYATSFVQQKPPAVPSSNRITLSMAAEKATAGTGSGRHRMLARNHSYASAHTRGRMAFFRPADGGNRASSSSPAHGRSRSTDDVSYHGVHGASKATLYQMDAHTKPTNTKSRANLPFTLRRCASSDHDLLIGGNGKSKPPKPKIAFGSFILPREQGTTTTTTAQQARANPIHFHDIDKSSIPVGLTSQGGYVHTHTRRSPYAAPSQLYLKDNQKSEIVIPRRPGTAQQARQLPQSTSANAYSKEVAQQRHSAPSSYAGNAPSRDKPFHDAHSQSQSHHNVRLSINTSPAKASSTKTHSTNMAAFKTTQTSTTTAPNVSRDSFMLRKTSSSANPRKHVEIDQAHRPNMAAMNMMSKRDKGASHHSFVSTLHDFCKDVS